MRLSTLVRHQKVGTALITHALYRTKQTSEDIREEVCKDFLSFLLSSNYLQDFFKKILESSLTIKQYDIYYTVSAKQSAETTKQTVL